LVGLADGVRALLAPLLFLDAELAADADDEADADGLPLAVGDTEARPDSEAVADGVTDGDGTGVGVRMAGGGTVTGDGDGAAETAEPVLVPPTMSAMTRATSSTAATMTASRRRQ
jgi:hypothetical protein